MPAVGAYRVAICFRVVPAFEDTDRCARVSMWHQSITAELSEAPLTPAHRHYIAKETFLSIVINIIISALFMELVFGRRKFISLWGPHGLALDFVPQTFMISAMSVLVPGLIALRRQRSGALPATVLSRSPVATRRLWIRIAVISTMLTIVAATLATGVLAAMAANPMSFSAAFFFKIAYGALIALIATPIGLAMALSGESPRLSESRS